MIFNFLYLEKLNFCNSIYFSLSHDLADSIIESGGLDTFFAQLMMNLGLVLYDGVRRVIDGYLLVINFVLQYGFSSAAYTIISGPKESSFSTAMGYVQMISEDIFIPLAAILISFFFCWQIISMLQESNRMQNVSPESILFTMVKLCICLLVVSKSWDIVNGFFDVSSWASGKLLGIAGSISSTSAEITLDTLGMPDYSASPPDSYNVVWNAGIRGIGYIIITIIMAIALMALVLYIRVMVYIWIFEFLMYAAGSPIPFATFINREWGQMGNNYLRKIAALSFQGVFMLLSMIIYSAISTSLLTAASGAGFMGIMSASVMAVVAVALIIKKAGSIAESIFNAH